MKFANQVQSKVTMTDEQNNSYNIAGINGTISSADSVIGGLSAILDIVGWQVNDVVRVVNQDVVDGTEPTEPTLLIGAFNYTTSGYDSYTGFEATITYSGDGTLSAVANKMTTIYEKSGATTLYVKASNESETFNGTLYASAGTNSLAKSIPFSKS